MKVQQTILKETQAIAVGTAILTAVMVGVFALLGKFDAAVLLGAVLGFTVAVLDFFLLGLTVQKAAAMQAAHPIAKADNEEEENREREPGSFGDDDAPAPADPETAAAIRRHVQLSYFGRRAMMIAFAALGLTPWFSLPAVVLPLLFPKMVIMVRTALGKMKG